MEINDLKRTTLVKLAKNSSVFIAKRTIKKYWTAPQKQILRETFLAWLSELRSTFTEKHFGRKKFLNQFLHVDCFPNLRENYSTRLSKLHSTCPGELIWSIFVRKSYEFISFFGSLCKISADFQRKVFGRAVKKNILDL